MATFSENQVRHLYVAKSKKDSVATLSTAGDIAVLGDTAKTNMYISFKSPGGIVRSDIIDTSKILYAKAIAPSAMEYKLKSYKVALDSAINGGAPVVGQDYILRIVINKYVGMSDEDKYFKYGMVHASTGLTAANFYIMLRNSLEKNFAREYNKLFNFTLDGTQATKALVDNVGVTVTAKEIGIAGNDITLAITDVAAVATAVTVTGNAISVALKAADATIGGLKAAIAASAEASALITIAGTDATAVVVEDPAVALAGGTVTGVIITEAVQNWILGRVTQEHVEFTLQPDLIKVSGDDVIWGTVTVNASENTVIGNGHKIADLEYFCMGNRGDIYRNVGFPKVIATTYLVDPTLTYYVIDLHYAYSDGGVSVQNSEKTLTIVGSDKAEINKIITAINTQANATLLTTFA